MDFIQYQIMKLEYLDDISDGGKYKEVVSEKLIRLYDFGQEQTTQLIDLLYQRLIIEKQSLHLTNVDFIEPVNCNLTLQVSSIDKGIMKTDKTAFFICSLPEQTYLTASERMKAAANSGYNWLCHTSNDGIDFLYSSGGTW
jgi:hypothetical protein